MDKNTELLNYVYSSAQTELRTMSRVKPDAEKSLSRHLAAQMKVYGAISSKASRLLRRRGGAIMPADARGVIGAVGDSMRGSPAEIMLKGSTVGIMDGTRSLSRCADADSEIKALAVRLLRAEESNVERLKEFIT